MVSDSGSSLNRELRAKQDNCLWLSSIEGTYERNPVVTDPSSEVCWVKLSSLFVPTLHSIWADGLDPVDWHTISDVFPTSNLCLGGKIRTSLGLTVDKQASHNKSGEALKRFK